MRRILIVIAGFSLVAVACGETGLVESTTTTMDATTTVVSSTPTMVATTTTQAERVWPPKLLAPGLVHDESTNHLVLFGGAHGIDLRGDTEANNNTWIFDLDDGTWNPLKPSMRPPSRSLAALAYDTQSGLGVMIGGDPAPAPLLTTWIFHSDRQDWRMAGRGPISKEREQQNQVTGGLIGAPIAYDIESDRIVLFGGAIEVEDPGSSFRSGLVWLDETWVYNVDANTWENMQPDPHPMGRGDHGLVYDAESDRILTWGGVTQETLWDFSPDAPYDPNVWAYDYSTNTWTEHINEDGPRPVGYDGPFTFDTESDRMVVIREGAEVWAYDYNTNIWTQQPFQAAAPINTAFSGITYVGGDTDRVALYGGCIRFTLQYIEFHQDFPAYCSNELWFYDLNTNTWEKIGPPGS